MKKIFIGLLVFSIFTNLVSAGCDVDLQSLLDVKVLIQRGNLNRASATIDRLIDFCRPPVIIGTFEGSATFNRNISGFKCGPQELEQVKREASDIALNDCFNSGAPRCSVKSTSITFNGRYTSEDGRFERNGCKAIAVVQGFQI